MDTYVGQKKESFTKDLEKIPVKWKCQCGMLILTNQKVLWYEVFNCFGIHSLFDMYVLDSTATGLMAHPIGRPMTILYMTCSPQLNSTISPLPHHRSSSPIPFRLIIACTTPLKSSQSKPCDTILGMPIPTLPGVWGTYTLSYSSPDLIFFLSGFGSPHIGKGQRRSAGSANNKWKRAICRIGLWTRNSFSSRLENFEFSLVSLEGLISVILCISIGFVGVVDVFIQRQRRTLLHHHQQV